MGLISTWLQKTKGWVYSPAAGEDIVLAAGAVPIAESPSADFVVAPSVLTATNATTAYQLTATPSAGRCVTVVADPGNLGTLYLGGPAVDTTHYMAILLPYDPPLRLPISDASKLYVYGSGAGNKVAWSVL